LKKALVGIQNLGYGATSGGSLWWVRRKKVLKYVLKIINYIYLCIVINTSKKMIVLNFSNFRKNLASVFDTIEADFERAFISRPNGKTLVVLSLEDFESMQETAYLNSTKANVAHLDESILQARSGRVRTFKAEGFDINNILKNENSSN
jgi:antitoxin YefM